tara:strand:+ start:676 stop:1161 length:486 start_codon:yes stop_codon:yes gene_type:complete
MEEKTNQHIHDQQHDHHHHEESESYGRLAASATFHCLMGCGLGEVIGMMIGKALLLSNTQTLVLAVLFGFVMGFILGMKPLLKAKLPFAHAIKQVLMAEGLSILVMETAEVLVEVYTPGVMEAGFTDGIFWLGMGFALVAGFCAAYPVNFVMVKRGIRHIH